MADLIRTLREVAHYPPHPPRVATALFKRNHRQMVEVEDVPCDNCGVRHSILIDPAKRADPALNPYGATCIELHHWIYEDSLAGAIDLDYFNAHTRVHVALLTGDTATYAEPFTQEQMEAWIHGHRHNLLPLCDVCHRHPYVGIHAITYPIWRAQRAVKTGFDLTGYHATTPAEAQALTNLPQTTGVAQPLEANSAPPPQ